MVECADGVTPQFLTGAWEVDIAGRRYPAAASLRPMYDPDNSRIKS
jgi:4-methylaminobutanoate oxidase (formaldehyde-forming)